MRRAPQAERDQRHGQRQGGDHVAAGEPEAEHRGGEEGRDQHLGERRGAAEERGGLVDSQPRDRAGESGAAAAPQHERAEQREREDRRPAQHAVVAVDQERHEPVGALDVPERELGAGGGLAGNIGGVGRRAAVEAFVEPDVQRDAEADDLDRGDRQHRPPRTPYLAEAVERDHEPGQQVLRTQPRQQGDQGEAAVGAAAGRPPLGYSQREQRGAAQRRGRGQFRVDGGRVREHRRREPDRERRSERPWVGRDPQREPVRKRDRQRGERRHEQLDALRASDRVGGRDQQREAGAVRLVQPPLRQDAVGVERAGIERAVGAFPVLVGKVDAAVLDDRLRGQQVVRLVARVVGAAERVEPERRGVDREQDEPECGAAPPHRLRRRAPGRSPSAAPRRCPRRS